jgi:hypothetical protein
MALDMNSLAANVAARIASGDAVTRVSGDEGSADFESSLDQAKALQILQQVQMTEARRKGVVRPKFGVFRPVSDVTE